MRIFSVALVVLPITACMADKPPPVARADACPAAGLQALIGQPQNVIAELHLTVPVRLLRPGQAMTMDFQAERLNVLTDNSGIIDRIWCG